jgi:hypothetical protein
VSFSVWVTGPDSARVEAVADEIARRLSARHLAVEVLDSRTPGIATLLGEGAERRTIFVAALLARHGVASVVALPASRAACQQARADLGRMVEVYVPEAHAASPDYEPPDRPEVEVDDAGGVERVLRTLEVLGHLPRGEDRGYTDEEEREVIRRLKAFGYL